MSTDLFVVLGAGLAGSGAVVWVARSSVVPWWYRKTVDDESTLSLKRAKKVWTIYGVSVMGIIVISSVVGVVVGGDLGVLTCPR
jgi:hypothetical protein